MSPVPSNPNDLKMLPESTPARPPVTPAEPVSLASLPTAVRQLVELPREELDHLAEDFGLDPTRFKTRQHLVAALHDRRQMIAGLNREAMLDVIRWGRRPIAQNASNEQIAQEIARITSMRFHGLSQRGLIVLSRMRGVDARDDDPIPLLVRQLKKQEGLFQKFARKRRAMVGSIVANLVGEAEPTTEYQYLPPAAPNGQQGQTGGTTNVPPPRPAAAQPSLKRDIEDSGLFGGISNRIKKTADNYLNQKLDEVEARIDRKLDEIDRRLAEWRDKEVANRIRILKITLWASVIVAAVSLIYSYIKIYFVGP
ncbi:MAG TPA: hypothetical protein VGN72_02295 [Tepidisphaeraceae bacterium]|jgi:hypothetical protein|nr:hypothetical protein [Tepidisphaeraceae bacterium]